MDVLDEIKQVFNCREQDIESYSPLTLAFIGDDFYDLIIRTVVVERANTSNNKLHKAATAYVKAETQSKMIRALLEEEGYLTEKEVDIYKRGRNSRPASTAKNASIQDYKRATGFETLIGYLYLTGCQKRAVEISKRGLELIGVEI